MRTLIKALVIRDGFEAQAVIVRNISLNGMGIASRVLRPRTGEMLRIRLPGQHELYAEVRWAGEDAFGVLLSRRLDLAGFRRRAAGAIPRFWMLSRSGCVMMSRRPRCGRDGASHDAWKRCPGPARRIPGKFEKDRTQPILRVASQECLSRQFVSHHHYRR
ncbi:PilZ domain-containing protein [Novosphingobium panipatense]|uniref:PilZ domain-containing protein n=1 Tax=Novosphingobium panipatense TaxID=428991 RepID=UPI00361EE7B3